MTKTYLTVEQKCPSDSHEFTSLYYTLISPQNSASHALQGLILRYLTKIR